MVPRHLRNANFIIWLEVQLVNKLTILGLLLLQAFAASAMAGVIYNDTVGDVAVPGNPYPHIDITSVDVSNTATDLTLKINLNGDPIATDWGKYMVGIDSVAGGDTAGNGWGRPISMSSGMDYWLGAWADSGNGLEVRKWNGSSWDLQSASYNVAPPLATPTKTTSSISLVVPLAYLGLVPGNTFTFDVYTSGGGGGDSAVDALGNPSPSVTNWGDAYNSGNNVRSYTVAVPEPATFALVALGTLAIIGLRGKRS
jgi:hypothetical protein